jgi:hypothetical protein
MVTIPRRSRGILWRARRTVDSVRPHNYFNYRNKKCSEGNSHRATTHDSDRNTRTVFAARLRSRKHPKHAPKEKTGYCFRPDGYAPRCT